MKPLANFAELASVVPEKPSRTPAKRVCRVASAESNCISRARHSQENQLIGHPRMNGPGARKESLSAAAMPTRRLATILCADVVGYSRLMQDDDNRTLGTLKRHRTLIAEICFVHHGRVVNMPGDSVLVEFSSAVEAFAAALEIQESIESSNSQLESPRRMHFRIGLDLGDILVDSDGSVYGTGVNISARMQALAGHGGIVMSGKVFDEVSAHFQPRFHALGRRRVKNIRNRVRAYEVTSASFAAVSSGRAAAGPVAFMRGLLIAAADYFFPSAGRLGAHALASLPE
jgi:class 3 adenylate cyclase